MSNSKLAFAQINIQHCVAASLELNQTSLESNSFIILVQEPYIRKNSISKLDLRRFNIISHIGSEKIRTCILASKNIDMLPLRQFCRGDLTAAILKYKVQGKEAKMIVASIYIPYDANNLPPNNEFIELVNYSKSCNLPLLCGCDANSHHTVWGSTNCNQQGDALLDFLLASNLTTLNRGREPTFVTINRKEVLDITLSSIHTAHMFKNWKVTNKILTSDHRCITFHIKTDFIEQSKIRNPKATDWEKFNKELERITPKVSSINTAAELDLAASALNNALTHSFKVACPEKTIHSSRAAEFFTPDIRKLRKELRTAFNRAKDGRPENLASRRLAQKKYNKAIRNCQRLLWRETCASVTSSSATSQLVKSLAKDPLCAIGTLKLPSGEFTGDASSTLNHLLDFHFPGSTLPARNSPTIPTNLLKTGDIKVAEEIITEDKIKWAIHSFTAIMLQIPIMLQKGCELIANSLQKIFIASIQYIHIPQAWRGAKVVFIPKLGQLDYTLAKAFRPISLTSFVLKTLERLIDRYLRDGILKQFPIHPNQHAYQSKKSAETALHQLTHRIEKAFEHSQFALGGFIDLSNAFSNMTFLGITNACVDHNFDQTITSWIYAMLSSRVVSASLNGVSIAITVTKGCPQGGVLPPLLYILVKDSLLKILNDSGYFSQSFADDLSVILIGAFVNTLCDLMQNAFKLIENWCRQQEQTVNTEKTKLVLFTKKRKVSGFKAPVIFGKAIELSTSAKVLGLTLDNKLSFIPHTKLCLQKGLSTLWMCRSAIGKNWGLKPKVSHWIYTAIVRPRIAFASFIWWARCHIKSVQKQLAKIQRLALISITGAMKTTPTAALEAMLNIEPLHIYIESTARATCLRLHQSSQLIKANYGHASLWTKMESENPEIGMPVDTISPTYRFDKQFATKFPSRNDWLVNKAIDNDSNFTWFSDGSRKTNLAGAGIYCRKTEESHSFSLGRTATIFQSEIYGILSCGRKLLTRNTYDQKICICSDSQSSIDAISASKFQFALVLNCYDTIQKLASTNMVTILWVPGHSNIEGNELADELARAGAEKLTLGPEPRLKAPPSYFKKVNLEWKKKAFAKHWKSVTHARQSKNNISISQKKSRYFLSLSKKNIKRITGVLTGHCFLNKHAHTIGIHNDPHCNKCGDIESSEHFLCKCPAYITARAKCLGAYILPHNIIWSISPNHIIDYLNITNRL